MPNGFLQPLAARNSRSQISDRTAAGYLIGISTEGHSTVTILLIIRILRTMPINRERQNRQKLAKGRFGLDGQKEPLAKNALREHAVTTNLLAQIDSTAREVAVPCGGG
ncbi:MAG TPA: hypothetical protein VHC22_13280 [Pirellulales bacterium]|nr:hypothetical protein [Pirellulales bacterium]